MIGYKTAKFLLISFSHASKLLAGFFLIKMLAHYLGPGGVGDLGHFLSGLSIVSIFAGGGVGNSVIRFTAEYKKRPKKLIRFLKVVSTYSFAFASLILLFSFFYKQELSLFLFKSKDYSSIVILLALSQYFLAFVQIQNGFLSGVAATKDFAKVQIIGYSIFIPISWFLISSFGFLGGLFASLLTYLGPSFVGIFFFLMSKYRRILRFERFHYSEIIPVLSYSLMLFSSALSFPVVEILIRERLLNSFGSVEAGLWQGQVKLSNAYLGFLGAYLTYEFLPSISANVTIKSLNKKVLKAMFLVVSIFVFGASLLFMNKEFFIRILLSSDFSRIQDVLIFQLLGDLFKVASWVYGFVFIAKAQAKIYIVGEIIQHFLFFFLTLRTDSLNLELTTQAYFYSSFIYFLIATAFYLFIVKAEAKEVIV